MVLGISNDDEGCAKKWGRKVVGVGNMCSYWVIITRHLETLASQGHTEKMPEKEEGDHQVGIRGKGFRAERSGNAKSWSRSILEHWRRNRRPVRLEHSEQARASLWC